MAFYRINLFFIVKSSIFWWILFNIYPKQKNWRKLTMSRELVKVSRTTCKAAFKCRHSVERRSYTDFSRVWNSIVRLKCIRTIGSDIWMGKHGDLLEFKKRASPL